MSFFYSCKGTPPTNDLNIPMGLECTDTTPSLPLRIYFYGYNPEPDFSGYNIYISTTHSSWSSMQSLVDQHISNGGFSSSINNNIISSVQGGNTYPTIPSYSLSQVSAGAQKVEFQINYDGASNGLNLAVSYYIGITAIDLNNVLESKISNIIKVDSSSCTGVN